MKKELICITCPNSCRLTAETEGESISVTGNTCPKGEEFARAELTHPVRTLTTTVKTAFPEMPYLPVRTDGVIPREKIFEAMKQLSETVVSDKVSCGDIILRNLCGTGCDVIATAAV